MGCPAHRPGIGHPQLPVFRTFEMQKARPIPIHSSQRRTGRTPGQLPDSLFPLLVESAPDALLVIDPDGRILLVNKLAEHIFGYQRTELLGMQVELLIPQRFAGHHRELRFAFLAAPLCRSMGSVSGLYAYRKDGSEVPVDVSLSPLQLEGETIVMAAIRDMTRYRELEDALRELSGRDELTGLKNRRGFLEDARKMLLLAKRQQATLSCFYIDLDDLKGINDRHGHSCGDKAIRRTARILQQVFRGSDVLGRLGGDEFAACCFGAGWADHEMICERLRQQVAQSNQRDCDRFRLSLSIGAVSVKPSEITCLEEILKRADYRMYAQKRSRRQAASGLG